MRSHDNILQPNWNKENSALQTCQELLLYYVWFSTFRSLRMAASLAGLGFICAAFSEATNLESISCMAKFRLGIYFLHREVCLQPPHHIHPAPQKSTMEWNTFSNSVSREQHIEAYQSHTGTFLGILARTPGFGATKHQVITGILLPRYSYSRLSFWSRACKTRPSWGPDPSATTNSVANSLGTAH